MQASIEIPVISRSEFGSNGSYNKGKAPAKLAPSRRTYDDEPLPVKLSEHAPRNARILNRVLDDSGVAYELKIGDIEINDVGVDEILDYVSAFDLEEYENQQFEEEREVLKVYDAEQERRKAEKLERMKERAKRKGVVVFEDDTGTNEETEDVEEAQGRHGRARPTYTHLFKKYKERRTVKSDEEEAEDSSEEEPQVPQPTIRPPVTLAELPKRRRRKRNKATGELLPLSPTEQPIAPEKKRQRRRRHPLTGELMPVGWRYDPSNDGDTYEKRRPGVSSPSFRKLSISQEHQAKRQRLDTESEVSRSSSPMPTRLDLATQLSPNPQLPSRPGDRIAQSKSATKEPLTSEDESDVVETARMSSTLKLPPKPAYPRISHQSIVSSTACSSAEPEWRTSILRPTATKAVKAPIQEPRKLKTSHRSQQPKTSILNPSAARASSTDPLARPSEEDEESDDLGDDEWFIESILAHHYSDPNTHPATLGSEPVMLYQVKWQGYEEPTWEPVESFSDLSVLKEYQQKVGLTSELTDVNMEDDEDLTVVPTMSADQPEQSLPSWSSKVQNTLDAEDEAVSEDEEYDVESIIAHQFSDPRTHPPELGKTPVMLYKVKWKGYDQHTWEPVTSFEDLSVVEEYRKRTGLVEADAGSDIEISDVA